MRAIKPLCGRLVRRYRRPVLVDLDRGGRLATLAENEIDRDPVHALLAQLLADRPFAPRPRPIARLEPGPRERLVIEHPELEHPLDRAFDEVGPVARAGQAPPDLGD